MRALHEEDVGLVHVEAELDDVFEPLAELVGLVPDVEAQDFLLLRSQVRRRLVDVLPADPVVKARRVGVPLVRVPEGPLRQVQVVAGDAAGAEDEALPAAVAEQVLKRDPKRVEDPAQNRLEEGLRGGKPGEGDVEGDDGGVLADLQAAGRVVLHEGCGDARRRP